MSTETERDEGLVGQLTNVHDVCRSLGVDEEPVRGPIEDVIKSARALREAEDAAGLNRRARRVIGDAIGKTILEGAS